MKQLSKSTLLFILRIFMLVSVSFMAVIISLVVIIFFALSRPVNIKEPIVFRVDKGASATHIAKKLEKFGIISNSNYFEIITYWYKTGRSYKSGEYKIEPEDTIIEIVQKMLNGKFITHRVIIPEGLTSQQVVNLLERDENLSSKASKIPLEGSILPSTYYFHRGDTVDSILNRMKEEMRKIVDKVWKSRGQHVPYYDSHQLVIMASIIEKESNLEEERPLIAGVFVNRLNKGMKLQADPTVIYAVSNGLGKLNRKLTKKDLNFESPYNTYMNYGLPPTPISNPGLTALMAAAVPVKTEALYFVVKPSGGHVFSTNLSDHNDNVIKLIKRKKS